MFLDEIEKNEVEYTKYLVNKVKQYFIDFYGEKYKSQIENNLNKIDYIFVDRKKNDAFFTLFCLSYEKELIYDEFYSYLEKNNVLNSNLNIDRKTKNNFIKAIIKNNSKLIKEKFINIINPSIINNNLEKVIDTANAYFNKNYKKDYQTIIKNEYYFSSLKEEVTVNCLNKKNLDNFINENLSLKNLDNKEFKLNYIIPAIYSFIDNQGAAQFCAAQYKEVGRKDFCLFSGLNTVNTVTFIHELNHAISFKKIKDKNKNGIEIIDNKTLCGNYTLINEVLTEYITFDIFNKNKNDKILYSILDNSYYALAFPLIEPLFDKYYSQMVECYMSDEILSLDNLLGKQNLFQLEILLEHFFPLAEKMIINHNIEASYKEGLAIYNSQKTFENDYEESYYNCFNKMKNILQDIEKFNINKLDKTL